MVDPALEQFIIMSLVLSGGDIAAATNTLNRIMIAMDEGDGAAFAACFSQNGVCRVSISNNTVRGTQGLAALCATIKGRFPTAQHWEGNVAIRAATAEESHSISALIPVGARVLVNKSYWKAQDGAEVIALGEHRDLLVELHGEFVVQRREIRHSWTRDRGHLQLQPYDWSHEQ